MTNLNVTWLLNELEKNEAKSLAIMTMLDGDFSREIIRDAVEELCNSSESLKLGCSRHEVPYCYLAANQ